MGAVLLQEEDFEDERSAEAEENDREKCLFDKTIGDLRLRPVAFVSHKEKTHSYVGEAGIIRWAVENFPQIFVQDRVHRSDQLLRNQKFLQ